MIKNLQYGPSRSARFNVSDALDIDSPVVLTPAELDDLLGLVINKD
jgi:hypothetical protein